MRPLSLQSGGYDLNLFTSTLDCSFLCSVCRGVLKRPVRLPCAHTFCKKCILQWLARQKTCPCCRKEVKRRKLVHVNKLRRSIGRLEVKCKNAEAGCLVTCPLARRREHQDSCPFELTACPNEGCTAQVLRGALADHQLHCMQSARQLCPLGCGATVGPAERAGHNCYRELRDAWSARQERSRALLLRLLQRLRQVHRTTSLIRRQLAQLGNFLEEDDILLAGTSQGAEATPGSRSGAQGQSTL
ncbi:RING finger protein 151 [Ochotona princeps]|uniref:RING finger protein 151 n=1 Tax=Ochotona princeps TaxID=9978 RepID=UPI0027146546|nr:RING finger protein 151 [Ochotona princeps]